MNTSPVSSGHAPVISRSAVNRVLVASVVGTAIEWYDFFLYATASALVFGNLFFPSFDPVVGTIAAFGSFAVGYLARPFGAVFFGHFGDRIGRKATLVATLTIMGVGTFVIGLLPTYASIGVWAPILLVAMRFLQGLGVGGEWGGAVLMVVETAPAKKRGFFGAFPQLGVPLGLMLSTALFIRLRVMESPVFEQIKASKQVVKAPLIELLRRHPRDLVLTIGTRF